MGVLVSANLDTSILQAGGRVKMEAVAVALQNALQFAMDTTKAGSRQTTNCLRIVVRAPLLRAYLDTNDTV